MLSFRHSTKRRNIAHVLPKLPAGVDQVVLVDGGSTDGTVEVARRLRPDMTIIQQTAPRQRQRPGLWIRGGDRRHHRDDGCRRLYASG